MRKRLALLIACGALAVAGAKPTFAQVPVVLQVPASTRAAAMANTFGIGLTDSDAVFYNAAFNDRVRGAGVSIGWYGESSVYTISAGTDWLGGAIGLGVQTLGYRSGDPGLTPNSPTADLFGDAGPDVSERAISAVYSRRVKGVRLAFTLRHLEQRVPGESHELLLGDIATALPVSFLSVGLTAQNLGRLTYTSGGAEVEVPYRVTLNASTSRSYPLGPLDVAVSAAVSYMRDRTVTPAAGVELAYWPITGRTFFARAGVRRPEQGEQPFTLGAGFAGDKMIVDYAFEPFEGGRRAHRFGVKWR